jgi:hypothetical protein
MCTGFVNCSSWKTKRVKVSCVPSGEKPSIESLVFFGLGTTKGLPPATATRPIESAACPQAQPSSYAIVWRSGESRNQGVDAFEGGFGLPPVAATAWSVKFAMSTILSSAAQASGSQQESWSGATT